MLPVKEPLTARGSYGWSANVLKRTARPVDSHVEERVLEPIELVLDASRARERFFESVVGINDDLGSGYHMVRIWFPEDAERPKPGQFVLLKVPSPGGNGGNPLLFRPFSVYGHAPGHVDIFYKVVGCMTASLASLRREDPVWAMGPFGKGFPLELLASAGLVILVGGGTGTAPLHFAAQYLAARRISSGAALTIAVARPPTTVAFLGAATRHGLAAPASDLRRLGALTVVATEDGSEGERGTVLEALDRHLGELSEMLDSTAGLPDSGPRPKAVMLTSGPLAVMRGARDVARKLGLPVYVCMEEKMGCGHGTCRGCVVRRHGASCGCGGSPYVAVCSDGPVFDGEEIALEDRDAAERLQI